jgi:hypothetical protein
MEEKRYYVYRWYNLDTNETFYIGKGTKNRLNVLYGRNKAFMEYYQSHRCGNEKIKDNMTENEAYALEKELIQKYKKESKILTNLDEGGRKLGIFIGKDNPMWKVSPKDRMDKETYKIWYKKHKDTCGEKNANYGKHTLRGRKQSLEHIKNKSGEKNGRAKKIQVFNGKRKEIGIFGCKKDFSQYLVDNNLDSGNLDNIRRRMNWNIRKYGKYKGFIIKEI